MSAQQLSFRTQLLVSLPTLLAGEDDSLRNKAQSALAELPEDTCQAWLLLPEDARKGAVLERTAAAAGTAGAGAGATENIEAIFRKVLDERDQAGSVSGGYSFSKVGSTVAARFYDSLGLIMENGDQLDPLPDQVLDCGFFDMSEYADEDRATPHFLQHIEQALRSNGVRMGCRDGFQVADVRSQGRLYELQLQGQFYRGGLDGAVLPYGVAVQSARSTLRCGMEFKHSEAHKARYREKVNKLPASGTEQGVQFTGTVQGQALTETLAAAVYAEYPKVLLLHSSFDHNVILLLSGQTVTVWHPGSFDAAMWKMSEFLKQCSTDRRYKLEQHKQEFPAEVVEPIQQLRKKLKPTNLLLEQLDTVTAGTDQGTKFDMALEFFRAARISEQQQAAATADPEPYSDALTRMYA